jgi:trk system potassium uptake protein TrkH
MFYNSPLIEIILTIFMFVGGCNFTLHYIALKGKPLCYFKDAEFKGYVFFVVGITLFLALTLRFTGISKNFLDALRHSLFQTVSLVTTTGYNSTDFELWRASAPAAAMILIIAMFLGGMGGSTGGGIKIVRILVLLQRTYNLLKELIHPRAITKVRLNGVVVPDEQVRTITLFFILYVFISLLSALILCSLGVDIISSITAVAACLNNVGPGFGLVGPLSNFSGIPPLGKWVLMIDMLLGRLEIFTILLLFIPEFWKT